MSTQDTQIPITSFDYEQFFLLIIKAHQDTNHKYDKYIPYEFHLQMALTIAKRFIYLVPLEHRAIVLAAVIAHDGIEDARLTYNDIVKMAKQCGALQTEAIMIAEMVRAVTNDGRGRNRDERMPDYIYEEIKTTFYSLFVKLCDRLANVNYGVVTGGSMTLKYKKEHPHFKSKLYTPGYLEDMFTELETIFAKLA
jgi:hypothetical protein